MILIQRCLTMLGMTALLLLALYLASNAYACQRRSESALNLAV